VRPPAVRYLPALSSTWQTERDVVVVGTGAAGLSAALSATHGGRKVTLLCKGPADGGSTPMALGGLAGVFDPEDTLDAHQEDTLVAGAGLSDVREVASLVVAAPTAIANLIELGGVFDTTHLGLEGGHSQARIVHAGGDASGAEVYRVLRAAVAQADIEVLDFSVAIDVVVDVEGRVSGLVVGRTGVGDDVLSVGIIDANCVVLASGGLGQAYCSSTNPAGATGDGLALAARAGAVMANVEFIQFHPTVMYVPGRSGQTPLLTEALRGAGARIVDVHGNAVMSGRDPRGDLAPRDVVSIAMFERMSGGDGPSTNLWLDASSIGIDRLRKEFPAFMAVCATFGLDPVHDHIPIAPGAHYSCGGIKSDLNGTTSVEGLYAIGEVTCTGVHGANRLASNSLTEALVSGQRLGEILGAEKTREKLSPLLATLQVGAGVSATSRVGTARAMSEDAGVLRSGEGLTRLLSILEEVPAAEEGALTLATLEATNLHTVSTLIAYGAWLRQESRGCHRRSDIPVPVEAWRHPISLQVGEEGILTVL
jgi:L-aspartate oxidase